MEDSEKTAGLSQERTVFQVEAMRPCLSPCSTLSAGKATFASTKFHCTISLRTASAQLSANAVRLTSSGAASTGLLTFGEVGSGVGAGACVGIRAGVGVALKGIGAGCCGSSSRGLRGAQE